LHESFHTELIEDKKMNKTALSLAVAAALCTAIPAGALAAEGDWLLRAGMSQVAHRRTIT